MKKRGQIGVVWLIIIAVVVVGAFFFFRGGDNLSFSVNLDPLEQGHYEGWAIYGEEKVSTGKFDADDSLNFRVDRDLSQADKIVITIEAEGDVDDLPSGVVVLEGDVSPESSTVDLVFPVDLSAAAGNYILATPTNGANTEEESGIWFLTLPGPTVGLVLPVLPDGWAYEGWAVNQETPLTTGRFVSPEGEDEFNGYSGTEGAPPFPGEDFLVNAPEGVIFPLDLADGLSKAVISVEPDLDGVDISGPGPFQAKPLVSDIPEGAADHTNLEMELNLGSLPSGSATLS